MVSTNAISSIEWLIENAVRENSKIESEDTLVVNPSNEVDVTASAKNLKLVAINISSYIFRIVLLGQFEKDNNTVSFMSKILGRPEKELKDQA